MQPSLAGNVSSALSTATARAAPTSQHTLKNVTFADMKRTWSSCDPNQLNHLLQSTKSVAAAVDESLSSSTAPSNRIQASFEALTRRVANTSSNSGGRTLQDAIVVADENNKSTLQHSDLAHDNAAAVSALHTPLCFFHKRHDKTIHASKEHVLDDNPYLRLESSAVELSREAANSTRRHFDLRIKCNDEGIQIRSMQRSLQYQRDSMAKLDLERSQIVALHNIPCSAGPNNPSLSAAADAQLDEITSAEKACERVMAQLMRQLPFLQATHATTKHELDLAHRSALKDFATAKVTLGNYRDPIPPKLRLDIFNNRTVLNIGNRQAGLDRCLGRGIPRSMGRIRMAGSMYEDRRALLHNRFSHAATINTHLSYPVYCLRFDRTGRYFITGADDYLVKVFCVGGSVVARKTGRDRMDPSSYSRGAVLVCTLKGHSGVINDIGVSSDNAFLATASADGDCRVWGLKDGCPVAILRGHVGGANMVRPSRLQL
jgi:WD domain, G-beta repeat